MLLPQDLELLGRDLGDATKAAIAKAVKPFEERAAVLERLLGQAVERIEALEAQQRRSAKPVNLVDWPTAKRSA